MKIQFFPFTLYSSTRGYQPLRDVFFRFKPKDLHWYEYDCVFHSAQRVTFIIFDMENPVYGGRGRERGRFTVDGLALSDVLTCLKQRAGDIARQRRSEELHRAEEMLLAGYTDQALTPVMKGALKERDTSVPNRTPVESWEQAKWANAMGLLIEATFDGKTNLVTYASRWIVEDYLKYGVKLYVVGQVEFPEDLTVAETTWQI